MTEEANSFAKRAGESRIVGASQSQKKAIVNQTTTQPAQHSSSGGDFSLRPSPLILEMSLNKLIIFWRQHTVLSSIEQAHTSD